MVCRFENQPDLLYIYIYINIISYIVFIANDIQ